MVIIGGGPGGYEAASVAASYGCEVTLVEQDGAGGAAVLTDCVPSKTLIATAEVMSTMRRAGELGLRVRGHHEVEEGAALDRAVDVNLAVVNARVRDLARAQSRDITERLTSQGVRLLRGRGRLVGPHTVEVSPVEGGCDQGWAAPDRGERIGADIILLATGTTPRELPTAVYDGQRILNWKQLYELEDLPEHLVVVGSGVTGAEFASAYDALGARVTLISSRHQVLPGEDPDAGAVLQRVFEDRGMTILSRSRAVAARREGEGVVVTLDDGRTVHGSHCLMAVGSVPSTAGLGLAEVGVRTTARGHVEVDRVSRTTVPGIYAAGDCTGVLALASVAAMQGRIAVWHALGQAVAPLDLRLVASNVFTSPEIATVGVTQAAVDAGQVPARSVMLPLSTNPRAKMQGIHDGFVKIFCRPATGNIIGGVVVAPRACELIHPLSIAVAERIPVDAFQHDFTVYPSLSGSLSEAARRLQAVIAQP